MHIQPLTGDWQFRQLDSETWLPATVPGGVHTDLMAAGLIPYPFVADNEKRVLWVAEADWVYRRRFTVDTDLLRESDVSLVCDGLDTLATINTSPRENKELVADSLNRSISSLIAASFSI